MDIDEKTQNLRSESGFIARQWPRGHDVIRVIALWLTLAGAALAEPVIISETERPNWMSVGRVNIGGFKSKSLCSGVLISPTQVLTAAHCVSNARDGVPIRPDAVKFVAAWHKGNYSALGQAKNIRVHPSYSAHPHGSLSKTSYDIALIELEDPIASVAPSPANLSNQPFKEGPIKMFGYRRDRPHAVTDYQGCSAYVFRDSLLSIDCDVLNGTSGAPVFGLRDGIWEIIGVVSSRLDNRGRDKALAALIGAVTSVGEVKLPASIP